MCLNLVKKILYKVLYFFFVCFIIGLPMWLFILYPTDEAVNLLTDPGILFVIFGLWITFSIFYLIVKLSNPVRFH